MKKASLLLFASMTTYGYCATWTNIRTFNQHLSDLKVLNTDLHIGGGFTASQGSTAYWTSVYDGSSFTHNTVAIGGTGVWEFGVFNNELYNVGGMFGGVAKWNGSTWVSEGSFSTSHGSICAKGNELYVGSDFNGQVSYKVGTGGSYTQMPALGGGGITAIAVFNNEIIVAGGFTTFGATTLNRIARWDGTTWQPLDAGVTGAINCMQVFNNELYVAGTITNASGTAVNRVAKWNGTSWSAVGTGITNSPNGVRDMVVFNNALYVVGDFSTVAGQPCKHVAKWTGSAWVSLALVPSNQFVQTVEVYNNKIYVGTWDTDTSHVYRLDSELGEKENIWLSTMKLFPNPAQDLLNLSMDITTGINDNLQIILTDLSGRVISTEGINNVMGTVTLDISAISRGRYLLTVICEDRKRTLPFVKQ